MNLGFSAFYHNNNCVCENTMYFLRKFDLAGICIMIMGSATPPLYYGFMCSEMIFWRNVYMTQIYITCLTALAIAMHPSQKNFKNTWVLATAFIVAGLSTSIGLMHCIFVEARLLRSMPIFLFAGGGASYIGGAILYANKWPESKY